MLEVLIDDPAKTVIEPLVARSANFPKLYDFDLMKGSGHLQGSWSWSMLEFFDLKTDLQRTFVPAISFIGSCVFSVFFHVSCKILAGWHVAERLRQQICRQTILSQKNKHIILASLMTIVVASFYLDSLLF